MTLGMDTNTVTSWPSVGHLLTWEGMHSRPLETGKPIWNPSPRTLMGGSCPGKKPRLAHLQIPSQFRLPYISGCSSHIRPSFKGFSCVRYFHGHRNLVWEELSLPLIYRLAN